MIDASPRVNEEPVCVIRACQRGGLRLGPAMGSADPVQSLTLCSPLATLFVTSEISTATAALAACNNMTPTQSDNHVHRKIKFDYRWTNSRLEPEFWQALDWLSGSRYRCFWAMVAAIAA